MSVIFISHSSRDKKKVDKIVAEIKIQGFDSVFLDHDNLNGIKAGEHWEQRLYDEIKRTHAVLLLLSPNWINSKWCFVEYAQAKALGKEIIPIIINQGSKSEVDEWIYSYMQKSDLTKDVHALSRIIDRLKEISIHTQKGFEWNKHRLPYPGMTSFEEADAAIFFGREDETQEIIEKINAMRNKNIPKLLIIVAASGMGKSSFLKAGVIPHLKRSYTDRWIVLPILRPTKRPLYEFAKLLANFLNKQTQYKSIYTDLMKKEFQESIDDLITEIGFISLESSIIFSIDQAEELYSLAENNEERTQFYKILTYLVEEKEKFFILWTLRSDFLKKLQSDLNFSPLLQNMELFTLAPIIKENVISIIKKPAIIVGIDIEDRLIEKIKEDMQTTDALPLLALVLNELYLKYGSRNKLTLEEYQSLVPNAKNPLEAIIKQKAEEAISIYTGDSEKMKALKEAFIPFLVRLDNTKNEYFKKIVLWKELPQTAYEPLNTLINTRLLIKNNIEDNITLEIAHEALIRKWPLLQTWLNEEHEFLIGKPQLEESYNEYFNAEEKDKQKAYLTGLRLQKASNWLYEYPKQLSQEEKVYIKESIAYSKVLEKRKNKIYTATFIIVILFSVFSAWQWNIARLNAKKANENEKIAIEETNKAQKSEKVALDRLLKIEKQRDDTIGIYWVLLLNDDAKDGHINRLDRVTKTLTYLDANETKKDYLINILTKYFSKKGFGANFEEKELNDFDSFFTNLVFRKSKYVGMELEAKLSSSLWLFSKEQLKALDTLLTVLLSENIPSIFQRYRNINDKDKKSLEYSSLMIKYMNKPTEELLNTLTQYKQFKENGENSTISGLETLLAFKAVFTFTYNHKSAKEFTKEEWKNILNEGINKIGIISRVLYKHTLKYPELYSDDEKKRIKSMYFNGIFNLLRIEKDKTPFYGLMKDTDEFTLKASKKSIEKSLKEHKLLEVEKEIKYILSFQHDNYWAMNKLSYIYFMQEKKESIDLVHKMLEIFPSEKDYLNKKLKSYLFILDNNTNTILNDEEKKWVFEYYFDIASFYDSLGKIQKAVEVTKKSLTVFDKGISNKLKAGRYGSLAWYQIFLGDYKGALKSSQQGLKLDPTQKWIETNLAHAYLFLGEYEKAKAIYIKNKGIMLDSNSLWDDMIIKDFSLFTEKGLNNKNFKNIEKLLNTKAKK